MGQQLFHEIKDGFVSTTFRGCSVVVKISEYKAGAPSPASVDIGGEKVAVSLLECAGFTTTPPRAEPQTTAQP